MSTITSPPPQPVVAPQPIALAMCDLPGEQRIVLRDISWDLYDRLSDGIPEGAPVYMAYDGKDLELMTTGMIHDDFKEVTGRLLNAITLELEIPRRGTAQVTWKRPDVARGIEADQSYYFDPVKLDAAAKS